jgi:hypothetical protein
VNIEQKVRREREKQSTKSPTENEASNQNSEIHEKILC